MAEHAESRCCVRLREFEAQGSLGRAGGIQLVMMTTIPFAVAGPESVGTISRRRRLRGGVPSPT